MRKLSILHTEASTGWGGQEIRVFTEAAEFNKRGHHVIIACQRGSELARRCKETAIKAVEMQFGRGFSLPAFFKLYRLIKQEKIDIVHTHSSSDSWSGSLAAKMAGVRLVRTRHIDVPISHNPFNVIYRFPDKIITTSEAIKTRLIKRGISEGKIVSVPTGVDIEKFKAGKGKEDLKAELGIVNRKPVITMIAVLRSWKGHGFLLRAVPEVIKSFPEAVFLIVGKGPQRETLEGLINTLGIQKWVIMTGHRDNIPDILNIADLFVLSSTKYEGVPQALLQAMSVGIPVVATNVDGVKDVIKDGETGVLAEPSDHRSLTQKIVAVLSDGRKAKTIALNGRKLVERHYSLNRMIEQLMEYYNGLVGV